MIAPHPGNLRQVQAIAHEEKKMETKKAFSRKKMKQHNISCQQHETILLYLPSQQGKKQEVS